MRLFLAIEPDAAARAALAGLQADVRRELGDVASALRWTERGNLHLTLHFLGDVEPSRLPSLVGALGDSLPDLSVVVALEQLGVFPSPGPPRTLWVSIGAAAARDVLARVHQELGARVARAAVPVEPRPFAPHLTLARVRDRERHRARRLTTTLAQIQVPAVTWRVDHVTLFKSDLSGPVPKYVATHQLQLRTDLRMS